MNLSVDTGLTGGKRYLTGARTGAAHDDVAAKYGDKSLSEVGLEIEHNLSRGEAVSRLEQLLAAKDAEEPLLAGVDFRREGELFSFAGKIKGFAVSGEIVVVDYGVRILVNLPWAARPFREPANKYILEFFEANLGLG